MFIFVLYLKLIQEKVNHCSFKY